ncbi:MAG: glycosyltransferase family 1 protein [Lachnospiraceae bacterium]|nr:glycosyltransferase family 1 protein [Lachnospiraceae bacterium]
MKHFLLFQLKSVCYDSYTYFSDSVANALRALGHKVEIFSAQREPLDNMEKYIGSHFDAIIDFNSELSKLRMEDDSYFLDQIDAPFYDVILDHPLYHHDMLKQTPKNFHVLCLDKNHKSYIEEHYPHISSVHVWAMTGEDICPTNSAYPSKNIEILFSGSYTDFRQAEESISNIPSFIGDLTKDLISLMKNTPSLSQENALKQLLPSLDEIVEETFPLHMQACFLCDTYLRAFRRENILMQIAKADLPLTLCGNGWRNSPFVDFKNIQIIDDTSFRDTFSLFRNSKITLNIMPGFCNGTHDRIYSAMLNHSLCLTDATPILQQQFTHSKELCFYDVLDTDGLIQQLYHLLASPEEIESISKKGYLCAKENHAWQARVAYLLTIV